MKNNNKFTRFSIILYWAVIIALLGLFFTNDFGLVDIHKTSIITAVGIDFDKQQNEVQVTAQIAVPTPSQSGEGIKYTEVQGSGVTIADALNEINAKTGFYPKLLFCKLIILGETCKEENIFRLLGCFYRKDFSEITVLVAMCKGNASDIFARQASMADDSSTAIQNTLSDELKKSANVSSVSLKDIAIENFSESNACFMPYIEAIKPGSSAAGGDGDNVGGDKPEGGGSGGGESGGSSGGESGGSGGQGSGQSSGGGSGGGSETEVQFVARKTAAFSGGKFIGILDEQQSFALDLLQNDIRLAVVPCDSEGEHYTVGLKNTSGSSKLKVENGEPKLKINFKAYAQIQGVAKPVTPHSAMQDNIVKQNVLEAAEKEVIKRFESLLDFCKQNDCDIIGAKKQLKRNNYKHYETFENSLFTHIKAEYSVDIVSVT